MRKSVRKIVSNMNRNTGSSDGTVTCCVCVNGVPFPAGEVLAFRQSIHTCCESQPASYPVGTLTGGVVGVDITIW